MVAARQTLVGLFVLVGLLGGLAALLVFGRARVLTPADRAVIYFHGNVSGLAPGAPVTFRGVRVGAVDGVSLHIDGTNLRARIPVTLSLDPGRVVLDRPAGARGGLDLPGLVRAGLRGQLAIQSLVTGQMAVDLDIVPDSGAAFSGQPNALVEIPAVESDFERLRDQLPKLPLRDLADSAQRTLHAAERLADALDRSLPPLIASLQVAADGLHGTGPLIDQSVTSVRDHALGMIAHYDALASAVRGQVASQAPEVRRLLATANAAADDARALGASARAFASDRSEARLNLEASLRDLAAAAASLRGIAHDVEADPSLVLRGRRR